ncbi:MAG: hypothetical protein J5I62_13970 [Flavobacteriales bacterium]|nr:hypothetical protein [Flavobacteriales bacterium]MEB2342942.1 hypothetical protein [Flavobacteriia bacterium]
MDDIGHIGDGRSLSAKESKMISAHIQAHKAELMVKRTKPAPTKATVEQPFPANLRARVNALAGKKNVSLDDIGFIGTGEPWTEEDARAISAYLQAEKAKAAAKRPAKRTSAVRKRPDPVRSRAVKSKKHTTA